MIHFPSYKGYRNLNSMVTEYRNKKTRYVSHRFSNSNDRCCKLIFGGLIVLRTLYTVNLSTCLILVLH